MKIDVRSHELTLRPFPQNLRTLRGGKERGEAMGLREDLHRSGKCA